MISVYLLLDYTYAFSARAIPKIAVFLNPMISCLLAAASSVTFGRESCYLRPRAALPSAAIRATFGRE